MEVHVESTRKIVVIDGEREVDHRALRRLRPRKVGIALLAADRGRREEKDVIPEAGAVLPVLIDSADQ